MMPFKRRQLNSVCFSATERGFSLVEVLISLGILAVVGGAAASLVDTMLTIRRQIDLSRTATTLRGAIVDNVNSSAGWALTLHGSENATFNCLLVTIGRNCAGQGGLFAVYNAAAEVIVNSTDPNRGVNINGESCSSFVAPPAVGDDNCPLRYEARWRAVCPAAGACDNPEIEVTGTLIFNPGTSLKAAKINPNRYGFKIVRGLELNTLANACATLHGTFDTTTKSCTLPFQGNCPVGQYVVGLSTSPTSLNQKICRPFIQSCPAGNVMAGLRADGTVICTSTCLTPVPVAPPPPLPPDGSSITDGSSGGGDGGGDGCDGSDGC